MELKKNRGLETATFAAGCFWHVEEDFRKVKRVKSTVAGYTGGSLKNPSYEQVCSDKTGHAEAVQVRFDPKEVSFEKLLGVFWDNHDPTTPRTGRDRTLEPSTAPQYFTTRQNKKGLPPF